MKSFKKIIAGAMAVVMTATMGIINVFADTDPVEYDTWETNYTYYPNTGSYTGMKDNCYMVYSPNGFKFAALSMSFTYADSNGTIKAATTSTNVDYAYGTLTAPGTSTIIEVNPNNPIKGVNFEITASVTNIAGNKISASGYMQSIEK